MGITCGIVEGTLKYGFSSGQAPPTGDYSRWAALREDGRRLLGQEA